MGWRQWRYTQWPQRLVFVSQVKYGAASRVNMSVSTHMIKNPTSSTIKQVFCQEKPWKTLRTLVNNTIADDSWYIHLPFFQLVPSVPVLRPLSCLAAHALHRVHDAGVCRLWIQVDLAQRDLDTVDASGWKRESASWDTMKIRYSVCEEQCYFMLFLQNPSTWYSLSDIIYIIYTHILWYIYMYYYKYYIKLTY